MSRRRTAAFTVLAVGAAIASGCGTEGPEASDPPDPPQTSTPDPDRLWDGAFTSTSVTDDGEPRPLVEGTHISLSFDRRKNREASGWIGWSAGCNHHGAGVRVDAQKLHVGGISSTLIGCPPDLAEQDAWLESFFSSNPSWQVGRGRLTLDFEGTVIVLGTETEQ